MKSYNARKAGDKARTAALKQLNDVDTKSKLAACTSKKPEECEIYIVEGDSAGGTVKTARNRKTQAVLPLRGKILNVEKATLEKILVNNEIKSMIAAFGCGIGEEFDISKLRYDKIIILTDADEMCIRDRIYTAAGNEVTMAEYTGKDIVISVSYTHLDVYKRQA